MSNNIIQLLESTDFRNLRFGVRSPFRRVPQTLRSIGEYDFKVIEHYQHCLPAQSQTLPSCVGEATANLVEFHISKSFGTRVSIDGEAIYDRARHMFWDGSHDEGLLLDQGLRAAIDLGILPRDTKLKRIPLDIAQVLTALEDGPLIQAHSAHEGWRQSELHPDNGAINEFVNFMPFMNGHATLGVGSNLHRDTNSINLTEMLVGLNSWGTDYGLNGLFCMTPYHWLRSAIDDPIAIELSDSWNDWCGWEDYIIPTPETDL